LVLVGGALALISSQNLRENRPLKGYVLNIQAPNNQAFLIEEDLTDLLLQAGAPWDSVSRKEINIPMLEENLRKHPLVLGAEVFSTWEGVVRIEIVQKEAKARVINDLEMMYVDQEGQLFPLSAHASASVPVISGVLDSTQRVKALRLLEQASQHPAFPGGWSALARNEKGNYTAYPAWHPHRIDWGWPNEFEDKAHKAHALYAQLLQKKSLDSLQWMDVRYAGQVVYGFND
jgi:cell division protein FtsQ